MASDLLDQIERIRHKLRTVPEQAGRSPSFGEESHRFLLNPPLSEGQLRDFEGRQGIRLPECYRLFLLHLGDGGAGPSYGLLPLASAWDAAYDRTEGYLARPCPLLPEMPREDNWMERLGCPKQERFRGAISIVHHGCSYYSLLVVSGPARGRIVNVTTDLAPPYFSEDPDFLSWYERWLDETALGYHMTWFGLRMPGDEADLRAVFSSPTEPEERRADAVESLIKLPALTAESHDPLRWALAHGESPRLREWAARILAEFRVAAASPELRSAARDPDAGVRMAAVKALSLIEADGWEGEARRLIADPDRDVSFGAMHALSQTDRLRPEDVRPRFGDANPRVRSDAMYFLARSILGPMFPGLSLEGRSIGALRSPTDGSPDRAQAPLAPEDAQAIRTALYDPDQHVRINAIQAIRDLRPLSFLETLEEMRRNEQDSTLQSNLAIAIEALCSGSS